MHIVLVGRTGSGKSSIADILSESTGLPVVSSGAIARKMSDDDPQINMALRLGAAAPEEAMRHHIKAELEQADLASGGWILEGFPRTVAQLICLMGWTTALPDFWEVTLPSYVCIERLLQRNRPDDNPDAISAKLESYITKTVPLLDILRGGGILRTLPYNGLTPEQAAKLITGEIS